MGNREPFISMDAKTEQEQMPEATKHSSGHTQPEQMPVGTNPNTPIIRDQGFKKDLNSFNSAELKEILAKVDGIAGAVARRAPSDKYKDLIAAGRKGFMEAYTKHDPSKGGFWNYASRRISGAVLDEMRSGDILPRRVRQALKKEVKEGLREDRGPVPVALEDVHNSLSTPSTQVKEAETSEETELVRAAVAKLEPRLQDIYRMYYIDGLTYKEISNKLGVSTSRISQLCNKIKKEIELSIPTGAVSKY